MSLFKNKYRIESARLQNWDYASEGAYFITICTRDKIHYFGKVVDSKMQLSQVGVIADLMWYEIINHTKNVELGEFVVMPNHIHGILILGDDDGNGVQTLHATSPNAQTLHATSLPLSQKHEKMAKISPKSKSVSTIIRSYKSAVTKHAHRLGYEFAWHPRFYDHIIRDTKSFENIQNYIIDNPARWQADKFLSDSA